MQWSSPINTCNGAAQLITYLTRDVCKTLCALSKAVFVTEFFVKLDESVQNKLFTIVQLITIVCIHGDPQVCHIHPTNLNVCCLYSYLKYNQKVKTYRNQYIQISNFVCM